MGTRIGVQQFTHGVVTPMNQGVSFSSQRVA